MVQPVKLILEEKGRLQPFEFDVEVVSVGRTADNSIKISDAMSSRHHCQVSRDGQSFVVEDLKSRNGTKLNGKPLSDPVPLSPGDRIQIGDSTIHFQERRASGAGKRASKRSASPSAGGPATLGNTQLRVTAGEEVGRVVTVPQAPLMFGRKPGIAVRLKDHDISNEHCMVMEEGGSLQIVDLGSTNGTFLNGERIRGRGALTLGSKLQLGATLTFAVEEVGASALEAQETVAPPKKAAPKKAAADSEVPLDAIEEIEDLDALDDDEDDEPAPPKRPSKRQPPKSDRQARKGTPKSDRVAAEGGDAAADALVAQETQGLASVTLGEGIERGEARLQGGGGSAAGAIGVVLALLGVLASVGIAMERVFKGPPQTELAAEENLVTNWSFEDTEGGGFKGWELFAAGARRLGKGEVRYGKSALGLGLTESEPRAEFRTAGKLGVKPGNRYRVRAQVSLTRGAAAAFRIEWSAEDKPGFSRQSVFVAGPPAGEERSWEPLEGVVVAPPGAKTAQLIGVGLLTQGQASGEVRFDRIQVLLSEDADEPFELDGPGGYALRLDARGGASLIKSGEVAISEFGLALDPNDPLTTQSAASIDQPLASQTDESLLALASLRDPHSGEPVEYTFSCRPSARGQRLRWAVPAKERVRSLYLTCVLPRLQDLQPLELDGRAVRALPERGLEYQGVREIAWGSDRKQVSINFTSPAKVTLRPSGGGESVLSALIEPTQLANGQLEIGFDLESASQRARQGLAALLAKARTAQRLGKLSEAMKAYQEVKRRYPHEKAGVASASEGLVELNASGQRLVQVIRWAASEAERAPAPELLAAARSALAELGQAFPDSNLLGEGKQAMKSVEDVILGEARARQATEVGRFLARGRALRRDGHVNIAREIYSHVLEHYGPEVPGVDEARTLLDALPPEEDQ
jgi:pSer/pThr/pTyr-binding forkhead associated (FHA) protein